ncbi:hypothetical protein ACK3TF_003957 [Chlorella vulgaris]
MALTRSAIKRQKQHGGGSAGGNDHHQAVERQRSKAAHWRELHDPATGRLLECRQAGSPAGSFPHTPWWHCMFHDPYERINFWSHALPGTFLLLLAALAAAGLCPGGAALSTFGCCAATTHLCSALTHIYPDSHSIEKADHLGIVATIVGTPITMLMAQEHGHVPGPMLAITLLLICAACLPPAPRVAGFIGGGCIAAFLYWHRLSSVVLVVQVVLYLTGAVAFLRNGGHDRWTGLTDHHFLHYFVTAATSLHVGHLLRAEEAQ